MVSSNDYIYDPALLQNLDWRSYKDCLNPFVTNENTGEDWLIVRPLSIHDFRRGYLELLAQLTNVGSVLPPRFEAQFLKMKESGGYYITVIEDTRSNRIIGSSTLVTEYKFIHNCALRGRLEDVVVSDAYRGKQLGKLIVLTVTLLANKLGCYKMSLDCKDNLIQFYKSIGYKLEAGNANAMMLRFEKTDVPKPDELYCGKSKY